MMLFSWGIVIRIAAWANRSGACSILAFLVFVGTHCNAVAAQNYVIWDLARLAASSSEILFLKPSKTESTVPVTTYNLRLIARTFERVKLAAELDPRLLLISGDKPNAHAGVVDDVPTVMINLGMLDLVGYNADEWAALLGHELAHLKLGHQHRGIFRRTTLTVLRVVINAYLENDVAAQYGTDITAKLIDSKFSRDQERQSDYLGVIWALEADYDPHGGASLHTRLLARYGSRGLPFLSSHPSSKERIQTLSALADRVTP
jgi:Zn-dependent protease with chaperone function